MERYWKHLVRGADERTRRFLAERETNPASPACGGVRGEILEAKPTVYAMTTAIACYLTPESAYYESPALLEALRLGAAFAARLQREDGSFDYPSCNFYSAPDTAFCFKRLISGYRLLTGRGASREELSPLREAYRALLHRAAGAIRDGGFHTPNHRWAIAAALLQAANLFAGEEDFAASLRTRAAQYLAEGLDCDEDGEYAERSAGNYNAVVNNAMLALCDETGEARFLDAVRRNLTMMLCYLDPDGFLFTQNSTRQDLGRRDRPDRYFYQYLALAVRDGAARGGVFDAAAHQILADNRARGDLAPDCLHILLNHPELAAHRFTGCGFPREYRRFFPHSRVLRVSRPGLTYSVMAGKSDFLYVKRGGLALCFKLGESLCETRNFRAETMEAGDGVCTLTAEAKGWYYQPFAEPPATSDWWEMDHTKREKLVSSRLSTAVTIRERENGLSLTVKTDGLDRLPLRLAICLPAGARLSHPAFSLTAGAGESLLLRDGFLDVRLSGDALRVGPGFGEHEFSGHYSGEEKNTEGFTVLCGAYTPAERTIFIETL